MNDKEYWEIRGNNKLLFSSYDNQSTTGVIEECLPTTTIFNQYSIWLFTESRNRWHPGSWLSIEGKYGNIFFKSFLYTSSSEEYPLSLYYAIKESEQWKMTTGTIQEGWKDLQFVDSTWSTVTLGSTSSVVSGTQYYRYQFMGVSDMAAYELRLKYRYGLVAYINGMEIYRDNLPDGTIISTTTASGGYPTLEYHSIIRPGSEVENAQSVLAIELHFLPSGQTFIDFNAFMALMKTTITGATESCFIYPYEVPFVSSGDSSIFDFNYESLKNIKGLSLKYPLQNKAYFNGIRFLSSVSFTIPSLLWQGTNSNLDSGPWTNIITGINIIPTGNRFYIANGYFNAGLYSNYRVVINDLVNNRYLYELQPLTCNTGIPTSITFSQSLFTYYTKFDPVDIRPLISEFANCAITPEPPAGLTFDSVSCSLTGKIQSPLSPTSFLVSSVVNNQNYTGSFQLKADDCLGTFVEILRDYKTNAANEGFTLKDAITEQVVMTVSSGQVDESTMTYNTCLTATHYVIIMESESDSWTAGSFLYVNAILDEGEKETIVRTNYDTVLGLKPEITFSLQYVVKPNEQWHYYFNFTTIPTNWNSEGVVSWPESSAGQFPTPTKYVQLYKRTFDITTSLTDIAGVVMSLRYQNELIVYINGIEVFNRGIRDPLTSEYRASLSLDTVHFRQISLPVKLTNPIFSFRQGTNTIAIAIISKNLGPSTFDCAIRLMNTKSVSRSFYTTTDASGFTAVSNVFDHHNTYQIKGTNNSNSYQITFDDDRHEWISSISVQLHKEVIPQDVTAPVPRSFIVEAKNPYDDTWTVLKTVTGMTWSLQGQKTRIWIPNTKSFNQYRLRNISGAGTGSTNWNIGALDFLSDATDLTISPLDYHSDTIKIYSNIEMGEVYPVFNSGYEYNYYYDYSVKSSSPLPEGIHIDPNTGILSGTTDKEGFSEAVTVTAKRYTTSNTAEVTITISVDTCKGTSSLISLVARSDAFPAESSYSLYKGEGTGGDLVSSVNTLFVASNLNYGDFCLPHGFYTLVLKDTRDGWINPAGYYLTVDVGEMVINMGQVYTGSSPTSVTTMFSSALPFQINYSDWMVYKKVDALPTGWNTRDFDDSSWESLKAAAIGTSEAITVYIRKTFDLTPYASDQVLNVRVKYAGGVVAYVNGKKVARFNLPEEFDSSTQSTELHDPTSFSKFHVILEIAESTDNGNVIAFEIHRPKGGSSSDAIVFDATGVFGAVDMNGSLRCSVVVDDYVFDDGAQSNNAKFFTLKPTLFYEMPNTEGYSIEWEVANLEGTRFNSFGIQSVYVREDWGFSLSGSYGKEKPYHTFFSKNSLYPDERSRFTQRMNAGTVGYNRFKFEIIDSANTPIFFSSFITLYCVSTSSKCKQIDDFPSVERAEVSYAGCGESMEGYSMRTCQANGVFGDPDRSHCSYLIPEDLHYANTHYSFTLDDSISIPQPSVKHIVTEFSVTPGLPPGFSLNTKTGAITGTALSQSALQTYTIVGHNSSGETSTTISIEVKNKSSVALIVVIIVIVVVVLGVVAVCVYRTKSSKKKLPRVLNVVPSQIVS